MEYELIHLPNGIRIVLHQVASPVSHVCMLINAGSRDERKGNYGLAHFIEHLLFKQTERRSTHQILNRLESVGGDLNAYTTKEYTCIHASFLTPYLERTLDLFEDLFFHSIFPENELEKEKSVIMDEMASYLDSPEDSILDDFEDQLFRGHELGHNILGTEADLSQLTRNDIAEFIHKNYQTHEIVIGITGNYTTRKVTALAARTLGKVPETSGHRHRIPPQQREVSQTRIEKPINQTHYLMGGTAYSVHHPNKVGLLLLNNLLGGMGMTSRLNLVIREKHGIAYTIESNYTPLSDTGIFHIYLGTDAEKTDKALRLVSKELRKLCENQLGVMQLHQAKQKFKGQIALAEENRLSLIISLVKNLMDEGRVQTLEEVFSQIDAVEAQQLLHIANEILDERNLSSLSFFPE
ncbi:M16 family metallopeptidase [Parapedobacter indicus]|uniref:Predicted Zn-dependent peptidase n=1 Tax=Parapedobacter indicus TaxID=1477437 RepID=A0A1I3JWQ9_9SPHI|nr:pitrilysin family protein [Parapedobacter indicus]PPL01635.1 putative Zn-dependent peptidase [Parapedobacter indicus]SFI64653.1 Predicted Zn-dependent peptidase [Parapedobacter indicus]